jgi:uncharacterized membrane protein
MLLFLIIYSIISNIKNDKNDDLSQERKRLILKIDQLKKSLKSGIINEEEYAILEKGFQEKLKQL